MHAGALCLLERKKLATVSRRSTRLSRDGDASALGHAPIASYTLCFKDGSVAKASSMVAMGAPAEFIGANAMLFATALGQIRSAGCCRLVGELNDNYQRCAGRSDLSA